MFDPARTAIKVDAIFFYQKWYVDPFSFFSSIIIITLLLLFSLLKNPQLLLNT